jgi:putative oligomerization/nucleic acid binding protein/zinc ribbon protein
VVLIFGWGSSGAQDRGEVAPLRCPNCHNDVYMHAVKSDKELSLYFIPLVPYASDEYLGCPVCHAAVKTRPEHRPAIQSMIASTRLWKTNSMAPADYEQRIRFFWSQLGMAPQHVIIPGSVSAQPTPVTVQPPPSQTAPTTIEPAPTPAPPTTADRLAQLARLRDDGILTEDEFSAAKRRLLDI